MKKALFTGLAAVFMTMTGAMAQAEEITVDQVNEKFNEAAQMANERNYQGAIKSLESTIDMALDAGEGAVETLQQAQMLLPKMYFQLGMSQVREKNFEAAVKTLLTTEELADLNGDMMTMRQASRLISNAYMAMGVNSFNDKDYAKALEVFNLGYKQDPQNFTLALYTAKSYAELDSVMVAADIYRTIIEAGQANPKFKKEADQASSDLKTYMLVASSKAAQESNLDAVIAYTDQVLMVMPMDPESNLMAVQLANNLKKYDVVIERGAQAAEAQLDEERKSEVYLMLGVAYQNKGNKAKALEYLSKVTAGDKVAEAKSIITEINKA